VTGRCYISTFIQSAVANSIVTDVTSEVILSKCLIFYDTVSDYSA
jgi:hypothetical protein